MNTLESAAADWRSLASSLRELGETAPTPHGRRVAARASELVRRLASDDPAALSRMLMEISAESVADVSDVAHLVVTRTDQKQLIKPTHGVRFGGNK